MDIVYAILQFTKDYWFLITAVSTILVAIMYMAYFGIKPWDQQRSVKLRRDRVLFHNGVGYSLIESGHFTEALSEFEESLKLSAEDQNALNGKYLANLFFGIESPIADPGVGFAIQDHISKANTLNREQHRHIIDKYLGDLHDRIGKTDEAVAYYESALKRNSNYPDALYAIGWMHYPKGADGTDEMEKAFRKLVEVAPYDYRGFHGLGYALYMKAIYGEKDGDQDAGKETKTEEEKKKAWEEKRSALVFDAAVQSEQAKNLMFSQLNIVMDLGEVARSVDPGLSLFFHEYGKKILMSPVATQSRYNAFRLSAKLLMSEGSVDIDERELKLAWIAYQTSLDYLALNRKSEVPGEYLADHKAYFDRARRLDPKGVARQIYDDQVRILDLLLPVKSDNDGHAETSL